MSAFSPLAFSSGFAGATAGGGAFSALAFSALAFPVPAAPPPPVEKFYDAALQASNAVTTARWKNFSIFVPFEAAARLNPMVAPRFTLAAFVEFVNGFNAAAVADRPALAAQFLTGRSFDGTLLSRRATIVAGNDSGHDFTAALNGAVFDVEGVLWQTGFFHGELRMKRLDILEARIA